MSKISEEYLTSEFKLNTIFLENQTVRTDFDQAKAWELFMLLYKKEIKGMNPDLRPTTIQALVEKVLTIMTHYNNRLIKEFTNESH